MPEVAQELNRDISALMRYFEQHEVHRTDCLTPGLISALLDVEETLPASLKLVISGGEALPLATCRLASAARHRSTKRGPRLQTVTEESMLGGGAREWELGSACVSRVEW